MSDLYFSEDYLPFFDSGPVFNIRDYKANSWKSLSTEDQEKWVEEVFTFYRHTFGFPYHLMSSAKIGSLLNQIRAVNTDAMEVGDHIRWNGAALSLCSHFFPHLWKVPVRDIGSSTKFRRTAWDAFQIDDALRDCIRLSFRMKVGRGGGVMPNDLLDSFGMGCGKWWTGVPSRFKPATAKFIWERYAPVNGVCYDYAAGWGGRLLGALSSKKNLTYVSVDPNLDTFRSLKVLAAAAMEHYKAPSARVRIDCLGSEDFCPKDLYNQVDVAFSSPPYFNLEAYSTDATQSHVKFDDVDKWLHGYMFKTVDNCFELLKPGGHFAINIKDTKPYAFVERIRDYAKSLGLVEVAMWQMEMKQRRGHGMPNDVHFNYEPIYVFKKS